MKRILALFLTIIMLMAMLASCTPAMVLGLPLLLPMANSEEETTESTTPEATTPEATTPEETTPEETTPEGGDDPVVPPTDKMAGEIVVELNPAQTFATTATCNEAIFANVESFDTILGAFKAEGYTQVAVQMAEGAKLETVLLTKNDELVTLYWIASAKEARVVWENADEDALAPLQKNASTGGGTMTMVQIGVERDGETDNPNIGMCYIFKLSNGNAIIIDGGFANEKCAENIYNALAKLDIAKNEEGQYNIEAWIFTHGHGDHNGVVYTFAESYADKVDVSYVLYQIPTNKDLSVEVGRVGFDGEEDFFETVAQAFPNATVLNPHVGLNYYFGNVTVSMLYTPDVIWNSEAQLDYYNNNSLIFKVSGGETSFLCLGDAGDNAAAKSWSLFDAVAYESGIFQLSHHGMSTGASSFAWDNLKKIYQASGAALVALPLGTRTEDPNDFKAYNGRWNILFDYPYNKNNQMLYIIRKGDAPTSNGYFNRELLNRLVATAETGYNYLVEMSSAYKNVKSLHGYNGINMIDNGAGIITYISCADHDEMATVFQFANGEITVKKNEKLDEWLKLPEHNTADVIASLAPNATLFESTFGVQEAVFYGNYKKIDFQIAFAQLGFEQISVTSVDGAKIQTMLFTNGMELATVYLKASEQEVRILFEKLDENVLEALQKNETTGTGELTFVQIGVERVNEPDNPMIGLCYIVKLSNGNAIVIDGGANNIKCAENIYNTLSKLNVARNAKGQYIIEAWIFTHGHSDHNGVLNAFAENYAKKADVLNFLYQVPSNGAVSAVGSGVAGEEAFYELCRATYPNANYINPKTGLNYYFGNATVSMLYTPDVMWSLDNKITYYNDTSLIFALRGGDTGFLCFGDAGEGAAKMAWNLFEESTFASGLLQITHHGLTTQEGSGDAGNGWEYVGKIYEATGTDLVVLPMGERNEKDGRNGRYSVLFQYGHSGYQMSFVVNKDNAPFSTKYFNADVFECFISDVETGSNLMATKYNLGSYTTLYGYNGINMIDNGAGRITYISSRDKAPMVTVFTFANGEVTVVENRELYEWLAEPTKIDEFDSTFNSEMEIYTNVNSSEIFTAPLVADGYEILDVTMIEGAKFETILLQKGTSLVTLYWFAESRDLRIAYDTIKETATDALTPNEETGKGELIVAQIGVDVKEPGNQSSTENNPNIGLCYVFKLSNGHAIIIDGGFYYQSNADNIYNTLVSLDIAKDASGKYVVEAWIFTHGHGDHNGATAFFFPSYSSKVDVKNFVYQLPTNPELSPIGAGYAGEEAFHELCKTYYPNANYINPRAGLTYYFGNAEVDMFHTPDIIWSHTDPIPDYNDSGIIFRVTGGGVEGVIFMGDSGEHPSTATVKNYDVSAFNANVVQISHHGLNTQINEGHEWRNMKVIYEGATAEYAFLPMGVAKPNVRSGRWSVLCGWGYTGKQASFVINAEDDARGVDQTAWNTFVAGILDGSLEGETLLGYNGHNIVDNGQGRITYIHCSETDPMVTIMSFKDGKITVELNTEFHPWADAANK